MLFLPDVGRHLADGLDLLAESIWRGGGKVNLKRDGLKSNAIALWSIAGA